MIGKMKEWLEKFKVLLHPPYRHWTILGFLGIILLLSLGMFLFQGRPMGRFVLFFPHQKEKMMSGEQRYLPTEGDRRKTMELVLKECLLGPLRPDHYRLFGPGTRLNSFIFDQGKAYADLSPEATFSWNTNNYWTLQEALQTLEDSLKFNFKELEGLYITVAGQVPFREISEKK
ncbi:MAG: hypothetical protein A2Z96_06815 [Spirochaetes bacterium GWB1_48_6]|nr:MAG: hypothetical protein A2Z96_06815 [Spirochaetes bacterium GWB1_48_6]